MPFTISFAPTWHVTALETFLAAAPALHGARAPAPATEPAAQPSQPRRAAAQRRSWPSAEDTRKFVDAIVADNGWDNDCRSRMIRFEADAQSFKVKVPRRSRAGDNDSIGAVQMAVRLDKMMRQTASLTGRAWDGWKQEQLAWLFSPHQPSYYAKSG